MELLTSLRQDEALPLSVAQRKEIARERWESLPAVIKDTFANAPKVAMYEALRRMDVDTQPSRAVEWAYLTRNNSLVVTIWHDQIMNRYLDGIRPTVVFDGRGCRAVDRRSNFGKRKCT